MWPFKTQEETDEAHSNRRQLLKAGITGAGIYVVDRITGGILKDAHAGEEEVKIPKAILAQNKKFPGLADAWWWFHSQKYSSTYNTEGVNVAKQKMGFDKTFVTNSKIDRDKALMESHGYHLLGWKIPKVLIANTKWFESILKPQNTQLYWYSQGCYELYRDRDHEARENFAKGIFAAAGLTPKDYERLNKVGIQVEWQGAPDNWLHNAERLGRQFVDMDLEQKEKVLNIGIGQKQNYDEEGVYWNLGFYILREVALKNIKIAKQLRNKENFFYDSQFKKFGYDTADSNLT